MLDLSTVAKVIKYPNPLTVCLDELLEINESQIAHTQDELNHTKSFLK